ncbi:Putative uncharacterized protein [Moritella viscosa]|uniref:hypothetical protein n=1 Tax=Moritella viscosa TaxID=80854 RepID=UPI000508E7CA|nr:hypothetical protein [Moritella viscosa]CED61881.1 putative uncharacterized protein [Moritella viscosa]SHO07380.1 Putative uncharacterized protein [Moritella viscosa]SHO21890.1 Putative uncharacterized protein [Moritella viscosa]
MNNTILTKADLAKRQQRSLESITTACSRNPSSVPPFFKLGTNKNSPIRFRLSDVIAWEDELAELQKQQVAEQVQALKPRWII